MTGRGGLSSKSSNPVHKAREALEARLAVGADQTHTENGDLGTALEPLLEALGWRGEARHLMESLPHFESIDDVNALRSVLARLNYETLPKKLNLHAIGEGMLPCLFVDRDTGTVSALLERTGDRIRTYNTAHQAEVLIDADGTAGTVYLISEIDQDESSRSVQKYGWMSQLVRKFRRLLWQMLGITFLINVFALSVPVYTMNVYDKVIGARSEASLVYFLAGILIIVVADVVLRGIRARALAYIGARCEALLGAAAFQQLLHLPVSMTERAPIGSQITRIKQFEGVRDIFTGTIASTVLDLPFMLVFLGATILIGGVVGWIAVGLVVLYVIMAAITIPLTKHHVGTTGEARASQQNFLIEMLSNHGALQENRSEEVWTLRFRQLAGESIIRHFRSQQLGLAVQTVSQTLVMAAGVATIWVGTLRVMEGDMTVGALIAVMALIWRVLAPINSAFLTLNRFGQVVQTFKQVNSLMRLKLERVPGELPSFYRNFFGAITFSRVGFRYTPRGEPALMGVTADIPPGQIVVVTGNSGAGKSTLLKIAAGLYPPQAGAVHIDGLDVRQINVGELRNAIGVVPQRVTFFHGTVDQNIRLAHPTATDAEIERALAEARVGDYRSALPEGRNTRLTSEFQRHMPDGLKQRLMLARAFVKDAPIYLLDEPASNLDRSGETGLMEKLEALRGHATILMVTHRPSHMRLADRILYVEGGQVVHDGAPDQVLPLILNAA